MNRNALATDEEFVLITPETTPGLHRYYSVICEETFPTFIVFDEDSIDGETVESVKTAVTEAETGLEAIPLDTFEVQVGRVAEFGEDSPEAYLIFEKYPAIELAYKLHAEPGF